MKIKKYLLRESITVIVIGIIAIFFFIATIINSFKIRNVNVLSLDISDNWRCKVDDKALDKELTINNEFRDIKYDSSIEFSKKINIDEEVIYPFIKFNVLKSDVRVYCDDELLYIYDYNESIVLQKQCVVGLPNDLKGKEIKLVVKIKDNSQKIYIDKVSIVEGNEIFKVLISENIYETLISGITIAFGIIVILLTLYLKKKNIETWRMFWIGVLLFLIGIFMCSNLNLISYIFDSSIVFEIITYVTIVVIAPTVLIIHMYMLKSERKKKILCAGFLIVFWITFLIALFEDHIISNNNIHINNIIGIGMMLLVIMFFGILIKEYKNIEGINKFLYNGFFIIYGIIGSISISLHIVEFIYFTEIFNKGIIIIASILLLVSMIYYSFKIKEYMQNITNDKILATLAYTDPLTGINNRTKYEEVVKQLKKDKYKTCIVVSFDLNNLKVINDENGHEAGDEYIKEFSKILRVGFEAEEFIGRIGGDEFIAIVKDKDMDVKKIIDMMEYLLKETMKKKQCKEEVSFAYGIAISKENDVKEIDEIIEMADKNMYDCKKAQKINNTIIVGD